MGKDYKNRGRQNRTTTITLSHWRFLGYLLTSCPPRQLLNSSGGKMQIIYKNYHSWCIWNNAQIVRSETE